MDSRCDSIGDLSPRSAPPEHGLPWSCSRPATLLGAALVVLAGLGAYANSFCGPFIFDDRTSILDNPSIRQWLSVKQVLSPPHDGQTVSGRPLLNASLAVNYAIGQGRPWGYHVTNLAIHLANALLLLGIVRRTLLLPAIRPRFGDASLGLAVAVALWWVVHPLQTESVTYVVQRAESLAGMFYLLTLYGVLRGALANRKGLWYAAAVAACWLGMATKETVCTAPLIVLLYDRTFLAGSFRESLRRRWGLYLGLACSWALLAGLVGAAGLWGRREEIGVPGAWSFARTQPEVVLYYLRLSLWPQPLCLDYGWPVATTLGGILPGITVIGLLLGATVWGLTGGRTWGFLGAWFFVILAPSSSIVPLKQLAFEHRMYLPLAAVVTALILAIYAGFRDLDRRDWLVGRRGMAAGAIAAVAVGLALGIMTFRRNEVYQSELSIWQDTVAKAPWNAQARYTLATTLSRANRDAEAVEQYQQALRINPDYFQAHCNLGNIMYSLGRFAEAIEHHEQALRIEPNAAAVHNNLGLALARAKRVQEAIQHYKLAVEIEPAYATAHNNWGAALLPLGRTPEAISHFERALQIEPDYLDAHNNLANAFSDSGRNPEAIEHYLQALRIRPDYAEIRYNLAAVLATVNRVSEAIEHYQLVVQSRPQASQSHFDLSVLLARTGRYREAIEHGLQTVRWAPDVAESHRWTAWLMATHDRSEGGSPHQAVELAERARALANRKAPSCLDTLAAAYAAAGRFDDAVATAKEAWEQAKAAGQTSMAQAIHMRLQLYRDQKPYREPTATAGGSSR